MKKEKNYYRIMVAMLCGLMTIGLLGCRANMAEKEKNQDAEKIYEVQIEPQFLEQDGVKVELENFYATARRFYGDVYITGNLLELSIEEDKKTDSLQALEEKYEITWSFGDEQRKMIDGSHRCHGTDSEEGKIIYDEFWTECEEYLYLEDKGIDTYYLQVNGLDEKITLKVVEPEK